MLGNFNLVEEAVRHRAEVAVGHVGRTLGVNVGHRGDYRQRESAAAHAVVSRRPVTKDSQGH